MGALENFRAAAKGLFGTEADGTQDGLGGSVRVADMPEGRFYAGNAATGGSTGGYPGGGEASGNEPDDVWKGEIAVVEPQRDTSIIAKGATVVGRIRTDGHLEVVGKVEGNIEAEGDVAVQGKVAGNIKGNYLGFYACRIKGNLNAASGIIVNTDSILVGDVQTESIVMDGKLKGNVSANQAAVFKSNSYLLGDIKAQSISIETGAVINGMVTTLGDDGDSPFDEF